MNKLYFGDNLHILREHIKDETVDLIYLGSAPFNSKRDAAESRSDAVPAAQGGAEPLAAERNPGCAGQ